MRHTLLTALTVLTVGYLLTGTAAAAVALPSPVKREIVRSRAVPAPDGGAVTNPNCFSGRLSTVNRRWASAYLTDTPACVRRFGGATGEASLLRRRTVRAARWKRVGAIGDNCPAGEGGAPAAVLRDLGCAVTAGVAAAPPTLGLAGGEDPITVGLGQVIPADIDFVAGQPTSISEMTWSVWGGQQATGTGTAF
jgi:hypothetical protein